MAICFVIYLLSLLTVPFFQQYVCEIKDFPSSCDNFVAMQLYHTFVIIKYEFLN